MNVTSPWVQPWKPFLPLVDMSQFIPLVDTIPIVWQMVFGFILLTLLVTYYIFLVIRASPWRKPPSPPQKPEPPISQTVRQSTPKQSTPKQHRQWR